MNNPKLLMILQNSLSGARAEIKRLQDIIISQQAAMRLLEVMNDRMSVEHEECGKVNAQKPRGGG